MYVLVHTHACMFTAKSGIHTHTVVHKFGISTHAGEHMRHMRGAHHELGLVCYNIQVAMGSENAPDLQLINFY